MSIKVFIGSEPKTEIARKVLEYSILKHASVEIEFPDLSSSDSWSIRPKEGWKSNVGTGFSLLRWDIPRRCNYIGSAIYLDADIIVFDDIKNLYQIDIDFPSNEASIWCTYQHSWGVLAKKLYPKRSPETSVMLIDCKRAKHNQDNLSTIISYLEKQKNRHLYVKIMKGLNHIKPPECIPNDFNRLNKYIEGKTQILHFTKEDMQPWYNPNHPHRNLWEKYLQECIDIEKVTKEEIKQAIKSFRPHTKKERGTGLNPYYQKYL